ncbi:nitrogen regulatory protein P-II [Natranaerovirga hydrolytica]|uniref:Nitrogen regulatory protein P-II n=1 Tax=Natranaerovirga hydrolytica TaxID=680378 RepID=A0A4R1MJ33_9FIRM|nr:P-II family nitrogen regulator [Natranaerovirga hydrolytica]TCK92405.1 nitrogen regulatory protein P-II [Natranaerovirga hydrolytica]
MKSSYVLFITINDIKSFKFIKERLKEIQIQNYTIMDTMGATGLYDNDTRYSTLMTGVTHQENRQYNKTIFVVLPDEETTEKVMDEVEDVLRLKSKKVGAGIMFSIPISKSLGIKEWNRSMKK